MSSINNNVGALSDEVALSGDGDLSDGVAHKEQKNEGGALNALEPSKLGGNAHEKVTEGGNNDTLSKHSMGGRRRRKSAKKGRKSAKKCRKSAKKCRKSAKKGGKKNCKTKRGGSSVELPKM